MPTAKEELYIPIVEGTLLTLVIKLIIELSKIKLQFEIVLVLETLNVKLYAVLIERNASVGEIKVTVGVVVSLMTIVVLNCWVAAFPVITSPVTTSPVINIAFTNVVDKIIRSTNRLTLFFIN